jgi:hypothetical protein
MDEVREIAEAANAKGVVLRVIGGHAVRIHCPKYWGLFARSLPDIDLMTYSKNLRKIEQILKAFGFSRAGYGPAVTLSGRRIFDGMEGQKLEVFNERFDMCHKLNLRSRLELDFPTVTVSDLLLQKLQIVRITEKDFKDILLLLLEHELREGEQPESINSSYISSLLSADWGFNFTVMNNLEATKKFLDRANLTKEISLDLSSRIQALAREIELHPKSVGWKLRSIVGKREKWYREVEEVVRSFDEIDSEPKTGTG